ncbi:hypothetical protein DW082_00225 [Alistipes sp. AF48-12]|jgi:hypothetical protein|uniref:hypothetical protein n=1 Tax=Alistipes sp. AF48-12 TaxID=2291998 RepID=UPI000E4B529A|nr:hypothetical protein [Alistipes sp. AF48-12]RHO72722.1 hypothetical protein DW082_00225 [Alistipes sp. AF48-12]
MNLKSETLKMKSANVFTHPLCPDCFAVAVIDDNGRLMVKYYEVAGTGFTGMDGRRVRRELGRLVPDWHVKIGIFIE